MACLRPRLHSMLALLELPDDLQKYWVRHLDTPTAQRAASRRLAGAEHCSSVFASSWQRLHTRRRSRQGREGASCLPTRARGYIDGNIEVFMATEPRLRRMFAERLLMIAVQETRVDLGAATWMDGQVGLRSTLQPPPPPHPRTPGHRRPRTVDSRHLTSIRRRPTPGRVSVSQRRVWPV